MSSRMRIWFIAVLFSLTIIVGEDFLMEGFGFLFVSNSLTFADYLYIVSTYALIIPLFILSLFWPKISGILLLIGAGISFFSGQINGFNIGFIMAFQKTIPTLCLGIVLLLFRDNNILNIKQFPSEYKNLKPGVILLCVLIGFCIGLPIGYQEGILWESCLELLFTNNNIVYVAGTRFIEFSSAVIMSVMFTVFFIELCIHIQNKKNEQINS